MRQRSVNKLLFQVELHGKESRCHFSLTRCDMTQSRYIYSNTFCNAIARRDSPKECPFDNKLTSPDTKTAKSNDYDEAMVTIDQKNVRKEKDAPIKNNIKCIPLSIQSLDVR